MDFRLNLNSETVEHAFPGSALCVAPERTVHDVMVLLRDHDRGAALICENERLIGIFTERDALRAMAEGADLNVPVRTRMSANPQTLTSTDTVGRAIAKMSHGGYRRLPIVDEQGKPLCVIKSSGILHYLVEHFPTVIYNLPPKPHHSLPDRDGA